MPSSSNATLAYHDYSYFPYERELARTEARDHLGARIVKETEQGIVVKGAFSESTLSRLVYFKGYDHDGRVGQTQQFQLEQLNKKTNRQSTRYSVHGMHEYKGKFNPQIVRWIMNDMRLGGNHALLDPFCGSGTSLVECAHMGISGVGCDANPLAVFIANSKLMALSADLLALGRAFSPVMRQKLARYERVEPTTERDRYLASWFPRETLECIEPIFDYAKGLDCASRHILLTLVSDLLRDYSLQEPADLRIRRRKSPFPHGSIAEAIRERLVSFLDNTAVVQAELRGLRSSNKACKAILGDSRAISAFARRKGCAGFDGAITSPPYATALPYIDTQRLSLVWLGLVQPSELRDSEERLAGSREMRVSTMRELEARIRTNEDRLPRACHHLCVNLQSEMTEGDGFRKRAMPTLLYRYFVDMKQVFRGVHSLLKPDAPFALVVGSNRTTIGGVERAIDTPRLLADIASGSGWRLVEILDLQTYQRYGLHSANAVRSESLVVLRRT